MKTLFFSGKAGLKSALLLSVLLLSACASAPQVAPAAEGEQAHRPSAAAAPQPVVPQKAAPVEVQQPVPSGQAENPPKKSKHNIEED